MSFFVPPLNYSMFGATAELVVVTTEDSTVVTVLGDYDEYAPLPIEGELYRRNITDGLVKIL